MRLLLRQDPHTLTGVYAVDAIAGAERDRFERHLHRCPSCDHEVRGLQATAGRLAVMVAQPPPPEMKAAVMTAVAQARQHPPLAVERPAGARHRSPATRRQPRLAGVLAAVAVVLVIALGVTLGISRGQLNQARTEQRAVAAVLAAPDARIVTDSTSVGGSVTMVASPRLGRLVVTSHDLPGLAGSKVYQLWLIRGTRSIVSAGLLPEASDGTTSPVLASGLVSGDVLGVTVEPAGGTQQPTTKPIVIVAQRS